MSPVRVGDPDPTPDLDAHVGYCYAPHRLKGRQSSVYCSWPAEHGGDHVSADVKADRSRVVVAVWPQDEQPPEGYVWPPRDRRPWVLGPATLGTDDGAWTDMMVREGVVLSTNRQCSIGWHWECSDRDEPPAHQHTGRCRCACHADPAVPL